MTTLYTSNFDADTVGSLPSGWISQHGTWAVAAARSVSGANSIRATTDGANDVLIKSDVAYGDGRFSYKFLANVASPTRMTTISPLFRANSTFTQGYTMFIDPTGSVTLYYKNNSASYTVLQTGKNIKKMTYAQNDVIQVEVNMAGFRFEMRIWNVTAGQTRPVSPTCTMSDSGSRYASGYIGGVLVFLSADPTNDPGIDDVIIYDDFSPNGNLAPKLVARNNAAITYSPSTWVDDGTQAITPHPGAYFKVNFQGKSFGISTSAIVNPGSQGAGPSIYYSAKIDGVNYYGSTLGETDIIFTETLAATGTKTAEVFVHASAGNRWAANPPDVCCKLLGILVENTAAVSAPTGVRPFKVLALSDSIGEGTFIWGNTGSIPSLNDATMTWVRAMAVGLNAEYAQVCHAGMSYSAATSDGAPAFNSSWQYLWSGQSRLNGGGQFVDMPDYILVMMGTNGTTLQSDVATAISGLRAAAPSAYICFIIPPGGGGKTATNAAVAAAQATDSKVLVVDAGTQFNKDLGMPTATTDASSGSYDGLHPNYKASPRFGGQWLALMEQAMIPRRFNLTVS